MDGLKIKHTKSEQSGCLSEVGFSLKALGEDAYNNNSNKK